MGWRRRGHGRPWPGASWFNYLSPWQKPGWLFRGFGRGFGGWSNPHMCRRFPWFLKRWTRSGYGLPDSAPIAPGMPQEEEARFLDERRLVLEHEVEALQKELKRIEDRLKETRSGL